MTYNPIPHHSECECGVCTCGACECDACEQRRSEELRLLRQSRLNEEYKRRFDRVTPETLEKAVKGYNESENLFMLWFEVKP